MDLAGWVVAAIAIVAAVAVGLRGRSAGRESADAGIRSAGEAGGDDAAFLALPLSALLVDGEARIRRVSRGAEARFPFLRPGTDLLSAFGAPELERRVREVAASAAPQSFDARLFADRRGTWRITLAPVPGGEVVVCVTDATEAADYQELRMQFVSNVSHELRTPLTGLRGLLEALGDDEIDDDTRRRFATTARHEAERLGAIIDDVLLLSELETSSAPPADERADLTVAAEVAARALGERATEAGVEITADLHERVVAPLTPRMAEMLASNLLSNAVNYAGAGAHAVIRTRGGGRALLEVSDDGVGISEEDLPHVFERFYRADRSRSNRVGGTGLGLAIVKHIAERAGGRAEAKSRPGYGTTVRVDLPQVPGE